MFGSTWGNTQQPQQQQQQQPPQAGAFGQPGGFGTSSRFPLIFNHGGNFISDWMSLAFGSNSAFGQPQQQQQAPANPMFGNLGGTPAATTGTTGGFGTRFTRFHCGYNSNTQQARLEIQPPLRIPQDLCLAPQNLLLGLVPSAVVGLRLEVLQLLQPVAALLGKQQIPIPLGPQQDYLDSLLPLQLQLSVLVLAFLVTKLQRVSVIRVIYLSTALSYFLTLVS